MVTLPTFTLVFFVALLWTTVAAQCADCPWHRLTDESSAYIESFTVDKGRFINTLKVRAELTNTSQPVSLYIFNEMQYLYFMMYGVNYLPVTIKLPIDKDGGIQTQYFIPNVSRVVSQVGKWSQLDIVAVNDRTLMGIRDNVYFVFYCEGYQSSNPDMGHCEVATFTEIIQLTYDQLPPLVNDSNITTPPFINKDLLIMLGITLGLLLVIVILIVTIPMCRKTNIINKDSGSHYVPLVSA